MIRAYKITKTVFFFAEDDNLGAHPASNTEVCKRGEKLLSESRFAISEVTPELVLTQEELGETFRVGCNENYPAEIVTAGIDTVGEYLESYEEFSGEQRKEKLLEVLSRLDDRERTALKVLLEVDPNG